MPQLNINISTKARGNFVFTRYEFETTDALEEYLLQQTSPLTDFFDNSNVRVIGKTIIIRKEV
tara:strand:+ start:1999 stop:2187 length:189 start_codon:yes stop_codon:yes gene_type:complete